VPARDRVVAAAQALVNAIRSDLVAGAEGTADRALEGGAAKTGGWKTRRSRSTRCACRWAITWRRSGVTVLANTPHWLVPIWTPMPRNRF